jgi:DNA repair photolyase
MFTGPHGRGTAENPRNRFQEWEIAREPADDDSAEDAPGLKTGVFKDTSRSIISYNDSPDVGFSASVNPYRGCEHGCVYCYARPTHEYLGLSSGLDFESMIFAKPDAAALLRDELAKKFWRPQVLAMSGVTDPYQPVERHLKLTRGCLEVLAEARNPVCIITKSQRVTRDIDVLRELARHDAVAVFLSVTTLSEDLYRILEPRTASPQARLEAIRELRAAGIPTGFMMAPIIPGLTDHEIPAVVAACARAGAVTGANVVLRLPHAVKDLFTAWLTRHFPDRKDKVLHRIQGLRGGRLNDPRFGSRMHGEGPFAQAIAQMFALAMRRAGLRCTLSVFSTAAFRRPVPSQGQLSLFSP